MTVMISESAFESTAVDESVEVLYLEDDPDIAELYRHKLEMDGYHVRLSPLEGSPREAIPTPGPDLLFVDGRFKMAGALQALAGWRRDPRLHAVPAVILTELRAADLQAQGIHLGNLDQLLFRPEPEALD